jgi:hypothetical protein
MPSHLLKVGQDGGPVLQPRRRVGPRRAARLQQVADEAADPAGAAEDEEALCVREKGRGK